MTRLGRKLGTLVCAALLIYLVIDLLRSDEGRPAASQLVAAEQKFASREAAIADAIAKNQEIFVDWPKPELALVFSGSMDGYLEPCGCAGLDNQKGGLKRRHTFLAQLAKDGWPIVALDMGGQIRRFGPQADMKYRIAVKALTELGYDAIGLGIKELQLDANYLTYVLSNFDGAPNPVVSANLSIIDPSLGLSSRYRVIDRAGKRIGVTAVLGRKFLPGLQNCPDVTWSDPAESLQNVVPELQGENCDLMILLVHSEPEEAIALAKQFPQFQFVATTGGAETPPNRLTPIKETQAGTHLIEAGQKGQYVTVVGIYDDPQRPLRLQRVPLDHRFEDSEQMQELLVEYQDELEDIGLSGLGLTGNKHTRPTLLSAPRSVPIVTARRQKFLKLRPMRTQHKHYSNWIRRATSTLSVSAAM